MSLIDVSNFDSIRRALRVGVDAVTLPDEVMADPLYVPSAIAWVESLVPNAEAQPEPALTFLKNAAILEAASLLCDAMPDITTQTWGALSVKAVPMDWKARKAVLHSRAVTEINKALGMGVELASEAMPTMFSVAQGCRGRVL